MPNCPNCGRPTLRTLDWACQWCGYPLISNAYKKIELTYREFQDQQKPAIPARDGVREEGKSDYREITASNQYEAEMEPELEPEPEPEIEIEPEPELEIEIEHEAEKVIIDEPEPGLYPSRRLTENIIEPEPEPSRSCHRDRKPAEEEIRKQKKKRRKPYSKRPELLLNRNRCCRRN
jgi:hypothetical protein